MKKKDFSLLSICILSVLLLTNLTTQAGVEPVLQNISFEINNVTSPPYYLYAEESLVAKPWFFEGSAGISRNETAWGGTTKSGNYFAFLQWSSSSISQTFSSNSNYKLAISFDMVERTNYGSPNQIVEVWLDNVLQTSINPDATWNTYTFNVMIGAGSHILEFRSITHEDASAFIDNIQMTATAAATLIMPLDCVQPTSQSNPCPKNKKYNLGPYTLGKINSLLDHQMEINPDGSYPYHQTNTREGLDGVITAFDGEEANDLSLPSNPTCVGGFINLLGRMNSNRCGAGYTSYDESPGYDYAAAIGTSVKAAADGKVVHNHKQRCILNGVSSCQSWGYVGIDHGEYITQYGHLSKILVKRGQKVHQGEVIGYSGKKAPRPNKIDPSLHFEVLARIPDKLTKCANQDPYDICRWAVVDPYGWTGSDDPNDDPIYSRLLYSIMPIKLWEKNDPLYATLTVSKSGSGNGTVTSDPAGINCGSTCSKEFARDVTVTLTANADTDSSFEGWSGDDCSGNSTTCTLSITSNKALTATFENTNPYQGTWHSSDPSVLTDFTVDNAGRLYGLLLHVKYHYYCGSSSGTRYFNVWAAGNIRNSSIDSSVYYYDSSMRIGIRTRLTGRFNENSAELAWNTDPERLSGCSTYGYYGSFFATKNP